MLLKSRKHPSFCSLKDTHWNVKPRRMFGKSCPYECGSLTGRAGLRVNRTWMAVEILRAHGLSQGESVA